MTSITRSVVSIWKVAPSANPASTNTSPMISPPMNVPRRLPSPPNITVPKAISM